MAWLTLRVIWLAQDSSWNPSWSFWYRKRRGKRNQTCQDLHQDSDLELKSMRIVFKYTDNLSVVFSRFRYAAKKKLLTRIKREKRIPVKNVETEGDTEKKASTERRLQPSFCFALCHVRFLSRGLPNIDYISVPNSNVDMDFKTRGNLEASCSFILNLLLATNVLNFWQFVWKMT